jgi:nicotinamidase-related amidase
MPMDISSLIDPRVTAVVNSECQENLIGPTSVIPGLAASATAKGLIANCATLFDEARRVGSRIYYAIDDRRPDGVGHPSNLLVGRSMTEDPGWSGGHGPIVKGLAPHPEDVVLRRPLGMTAFFNTGLDTYLRNTGVTTIILSGVSLNIAILGSSMEAMNLGYHIVIASDCVASDPPEYQDTLVRYTLRNVAYVVPSSTILAHWGMLSDNPLRK